MKICSARLKYFTIFNLVMCVCLYITSARAGGLWLYEQPTPDMGTAAAGRAALAKDAATAAGNPAGMTRLERSQLVTGFLAIDVTAKFDADSSTTFSGGNGGDAGYFSPGLGLSYVYSLTEDLKLGLVVGSYFGLGLDYGDGWAGRYYTQDGEFLTAGINPVVAYRICEWLSIGGGFNVILSKFGAKVAINNLLPGLYDGRLKYEDEDVGYGGNAGVLVEPREGTRFGITWRSEVNFHFKDRPDIHGLGPLLSEALLKSDFKGDKLKIDMTLPQGVMFSAYHDLTDRLAIMGNVGWQDWSEFGHVEVSVGDSTSTTKNLHYRDTWHWAIGAHYRITEPWLLSVGFAYDTSPISKSSNRSPSLPLDRQIRYATGIQYDWSEDITLGFAYTFLDTGEADINQSGGRFKGNIRGDYKSNYINFFNVNVVWKF